MASNRLIAKNTIALYFRMIVLMIVTLYTSRVVLEVLGVDDYGIYSLVNGIVISFAFIRNVLLSAAQRFFATAIGNNDKEELSSYFSTSIWVFCIVGLLITILLGVVGFWFLTEKLQIPEHRIHSAEILFFLTIVDFFFSFIRIPYNALIISYERMSFFAYVSIAEAILKLVIVYILLLDIGDALVVYGFLLLAVTILINGLYVSYVHIKIPDCRVSSSIKSQQAKSIMSFSGWSLYEAMSNVAKTEGVGFIMNVFYGVTINAAVGVAKQVTSAVYSFVGNFQTAFRPQITKDYAAGKHKDLEELIYNSAKMSGAIFMVVAVPLCLNMDYVLHLWLNIVPEYTRPFAICLIASLCVETLGGPLWMASHAIGNIKSYQLVTGTIRLFNLPLVYLLLKNGVSPSYVYAFQIIFDVVILVYRIQFLQNHDFFSAKRFYLDVIFKLLSITLITIIIIVLVKEVFSGGFVDLVFSVIASIIAYGFGAWILLMNKNQRRAVCQYIGLRLNRKKDKYLESL